MVLVVEPPLFKAWKIFIDLILIDDLKPERRERSEAKAVGLNSKTS
jgi:hypothetical protein